MPTDFVECLVKTEVSETSGLNLAVRFEEFKQENLLQEVHKVLAKYQREESAWDHRKLVTFVQAFAALLVQRFSLDIHELVFGVDHKFRFLEAIRFRRGVNALGLRGEIQVNAKHAESVATWQLLGSLLKALLEAWHQEHSPGAANYGYYDAEYRRKASDCGLDIGEDGSIRIAANGMFTKLMNELGIDLPSEEDLRAPMSKPKGDSKQKKWSCSGCEPEVNARVAISDFQAECLKCRRLFVRSDDKEQRVKWTALTDPRRKKWLEWTTALCQIGYGSQDPTNDIVALLHEITGLQLADVCGLLEEARTVGRSSGENEAETDTTKQARRNLHCMI